MLFETIQNKIWALSVSAGTSPYTFLSFKIDEKWHQILAEDEIEGYSQGIAFLVWDDYTLEEYKDYLVNSKEYLLITDPSHREKFLQGQIAQHKEPKKLRQWQYNQMYIALGVALGEIKNKGCTYREVASHHMDLFKPLIKAKEGTLAEIILFE